MKTPLQAEGLARRVYPFLGLAIVGLVSLRGFGSIIASPPLLVATALGALLVLAPLVPFEAPSVGRLASAVPVLLGFGLALYPLWGSGSVVGIVISGILAALGPALSLSPWGQFRRPCTPSHQSEASRLPLCWKLSSDRACCMHFLSCSCRCCSWPCTTQPSNSPSAPPLRSRTSSQWRLPIRALQTPGLGFSPPSCSSRSGPLCAGSWPTSSAAAPTPPPPRRGGQMCCPISPSATRSSRS